jgi:hypothetical protein
LADSDFCIHIQIIGTLADHLAEWILPSMAVRMIRPRFLTAINRWQEAAESLG